MWDDKVTTADLLNQWREATRAAELAERLARMAAEAVERADADVVEANEIASMAEQAAEAAGRAATTARKAADRATTFASKTRTGRGDADGTVLATRASEAGARDAYHAAERDARSRHDGDD